MEVVESCLKHKFQVVHLKWLLGIIVIATLIIQYSFHVIFGYDFHTNAKMKAKKLNFKCPSSFNF